MKDIFIDNCVAVKFSNPVDDSYKELIKWLMEYNQNENDAYLAVSQYLLNEYYASFQNCVKTTSIPIIIDKLQREGRLNKISKKEISNFQKKYFTKTVKKNLRSNEKDQKHIPVVFLSKRKLALTTDINFTYDLKNFNGFSCSVEDNPAKLDYKN